MRRLSPEDALRLNVLLAKNLRAIRIDESAMAVLALLDEGEVRFQLNPTVKDEAYLKYLRAALSAHVLGSSGAYPLYLKRWMRSGQARNEDRLRKLLLLGEPEALAAVVYAENLSSELARYAWWVEPSAENARRMLESQAIADSDMGPALAEFLIEFLPFETHSCDVIDSLRLALSHHSVADEVCDDLWNKGKRNNAYLVGFLLAMPDRLPMAGQPHPDFFAIKSILNSVAERQPTARYLLKLLSASGQKFLYTVAEALRRSSDQNTLIYLLQAIRRYFAEWMIHSANYREIEALRADSRALSSDALMPDGLADLLPQYREQVEAMIALALINVSLLDPVFGLTDAIGSVMRKKIVPITEPIFN